VQKQTATAAQNCRNKQLQ